MFRMNPFFWTFSVIIFSTICDTSSSSSTFSSFSSPSLSSYSSSSPSPSSESSSCPTSTNSISDPLSSILKSQIDLEEYENIEHDNAVWSAISQSLNEWRERRKLKQATKNRNHNHDDEKHESKNGVKVRRRRDEETVCYKHFGCFRDEGAFDYLDTLPASPEAINTTFLLYTRKNLNDGQILDYNNQSSLLESNFNSSAPVKVIIHGFGSSSRRPWVQQMTEALLNLDDFNVINVDWENGSRMPNYVQAAANTQLIGKQLAKLIRMIQYVTNTPPSHYHLIGFSLGAHVAGFTGSELANISRITGLDPASPLFEGYQPRVRLDPTDADFVDVIHSNGDSLVKGGLGSYSPMGHVDFYPNGGRVQVGCNSVLMGAISDIIYGKWNSLCNHRRAFRFFIDSMSTSCTFRAFACDSYENYVKGACFSCGPDGALCSNMGYWAHKAPGRGNMYLITREKEPFCANDYRIRLESGAEGQGATWGRVEVSLLTPEGQNETFVLSNEAEELKEGSQIQALVVAHPQLLNISQVQITYVKYKGWIYNGKAEWPVDKFELLNAHGTIKSYCARGTRLATGQPTRILLTPGNCTLPNNMSSATMIESNDVTIPIQSGGKTVYRKGFGKHSDVPEEMGGTANQIVTEPGNDSVNGAGMSSMIWKFIGLDTTTTSSISGPDTDGSVKAPDSTTNRTLVLPVFELTDNVASTETSDATVLSSHEDKNKQLNSQNIGEESLFRSNESDEFNDRDLHETSKHLRTFGKNAKDSFRPSFGKFGRRPSIVGLIRTSRASKYADHSPNQSVRWTSRASNFVRNRTAQFFMKFVHFPSSGNVHKSQPISLPLSSSPSSVPSSPSSGSSLGPSLSPPSSAPSPSSPVSSVGPSLQQTAPLSTDNTPTHPYEHNSLALSGSLNEEGPNNEQTPAVSSSSAYWLLSTTNGAPIVLESTQSNTNIIDHFQPFTLSTAVTTGVQSPTQQQHQHQYLHNQRSLPVSGVSFGPYYESSSN